MSTGNPALPADEQAAYDCVVMNRAGLFRFLMEFQQSVALFEFLERGGGPPSVGVFGGVFINWRMIAAREGALSIYHFGCALSAVRHQLAACNSFTTVNRTQVRDAARMFRARFPHSETVRHAIAHAGELHDTPAKMKKQLQKAAFAVPGVSGAPGGVLVGALFERTYSLGFEGEVFSVVMDNQTTETLIRIMSMVSAAFTPAPDQTSSATK